MSLGRTFAALAHSLAIGCTCSLGLGGCSDDCVAVPVDCAPLYAPSFDNVFTRTLVPTCASGGSSCHAPSGGRGGLVFEDQAAAYDALVGHAAGSGGTRVIAGDAGCSLLVQKLESTDEAFQMPPGSPLSAPERCAIEQWIADGAAP